MSAQAPGPPTGPPPGPPSGPPPGPPSGPSSSGSGPPLTWKALAIALVAVIVVLGVVIAVVASSGDDEATAAEVTLEPVSTSGDNPFMASVGTDEADVTPPPRSGGTFTGNTPGLYGGTLNNASCDATQLVTFLSQNAEKARVWAGVLGINVGDIATYVDELTPVILRADVAVTNHGFDNGRATTIPAILQSGTAVLVDKYGFPAVKCYCGNPLTRPRVYASPTYTGTRWRWFEPTSITIVKQTTVIIDTFTLVDPRTGESFSRPAGTDGTADRPTTPTPPPTVPTTAPTLPPTTATTQPAGPSPEDQAVAKVTQASQECYPFPAPIEDSTGSTNAFESGSTPNSFVLQVTTQTAGGSQVFRWEVDRSTIAFTPLNDLAQVASNHCGLLN